MTPYYNPIGDSSPQGITVGSDGNIWYALGLDNEIAKSTCQSWRNIALHTPFDQRLHPGNEMTAITTTFTPVSRE